MTRFQPVHSRDRAARLHMLSRAHLDGARSTLPTSSDIPTSTQSHDALRSRIDADDESNEWSDDDGQDATATSSDDET